MPMPQTDHGITTNLGQLSIFLLVPFMPAVLSPYISLPCFVPQKPSEWVGGGYEWAASFASFLPSSTCSTLSSIFLSFSSIYSILMLLLPPAILNLCCFSFRLSSCASISSICWFQECCSASCPCSQFFLHLSSLSSP